MKRVKFIQRVLTCSAMIMVPIVTRARSIFSGRERGFKVEAGKSRYGKGIALFDGDTFFTKVAAADTDHDLYVFESTRSREGGPPLHYHYEQDEWWYVLQGEFLFKVGDETFIARAGDSVFGPRMVPHAFAKLGAGEARLLMLFQPAGRMEENFQAISEGVTAKMTESERNAFRKKNGFEVVGPALTNLKQ